MLYIEFESTEIHVCILGVSEEPLLPSPTLDSAGVAKGKKNMLFFFIRLMLEKFTLSMVRTNYTFRNHTLLFGNCFTLF